MKQIFWTAYCSKDRISAITEIKVIVGEFGFITDFKHFSDISLSVKVELAESRVGPLYDSLKKLMSIDEYFKINSASADECVIFINITFTSGTGNLRIEVPAVPG